MLSSDKNPKYNKPRNFAKKKDISRNNFRIKFDFLPSSVADCHVVGKLYGHLIPQHPNLNSYILKNWLWILVKSPKFTLPISLKFSWWPAPNPVSHDVLIDDQSDACYIFRLQAEPSSDTVKEDGSVYKENIQTKIVQKKTIYKTNYIYSRC